MHACAYFTSSPCIISNQVDCLANAEYCFSQARLVALQLSVLQSGKQVVNLDVKRVRKYMEEQPFSEVSRINVFS